LPDAGHGGVVSLTCPHGDSPSASNGGDVVVAPGSCVEKAGNTPSLLYGTHWHASESNSVNDPPEFPKQYTGLPLPSASIILTTLRRYNRIPVAAHAVTRCHHVIRRLSPALTLVG